MLFDTQSPNRRRAVQVIFASLAILMGGGLVLFGIGSVGNGGGLVDAFNGNGSSVSVDKAAKKDAEAAQKVLDANPKDVAAAEKLAKANLLIATTSGFDANGNAVKDGGQALLTAADNAWTAYLALGPSKPNASLATQYSAFYAQPGVAKYDKSARALEALLVTRKPTAGIYAQLAQYLIASGNTDKYKEARAKAIELSTTKSQRDGIVKALDSIQKYVEDYQKKAAADAKASSGTGDATSSTPALKTLPGLTQ